MPLTNDQVIWITDKYGIALDEYEGKYKLQGVTKYQKNGEDVLTWDWIYRSTWNKDTRQREVPAKANGVSGISLGNREEAVRKLASILRSLGAPVMGAVASAQDQEEDEIPF